LARLCTLNGGLPQGAPTSPAIANLVFREADSELARIAEKNNLRYSRYADDLTFSGMEHISWTFLDDIEGIIRRFGFKLNARKTRFGSESTRMEVTGYTTNLFTQPPREWRKRVRAELHKLSKKERLSDKDRKRVAGIKGNLLSCDRSDGVTKLIQSINLIIK
jgi:RNA-directed DNA polymerase